MAKKTCFMLCIFLAIMHISICFCEDEIVLYEDLLHIGELYPVEGSKLTMPIKLEVVVGTVKKDETSTNPNYYYDLWIRGKEGYHYIFETVYTFAEKLSFEPVKGQRLIISVIPYSDGSFSQSDISSYDVIEENVDVDSLTAEYKNTEYHSLPYKKVLRNPENYKGYPVYVEGELFHIPGDGRAPLLKTEDGNIIRFMYLEEALEYKLLLKDHIRVYGSIWDIQPTYTYESWSGTQTVPNIYCDFIDLIEE